MLNPGTARTSRIFGPSVSSLCLKSANNNHKSGYSGCTFQIASKAQPGKRKERASEGEWLQLLKFPGTGKTFFAWTRIKQTVQVFITTVCLSIDIRKVIYATDGRNASQELCCLTSFSCISQDVILSRLLVEEERRQLGKSGKFILMLPKHSNTSF